MKRYIALKNISVGNIVLSLAGTLPGYYATFFLVDKWGRKPIQLLGFTMMTITVRPHPILKCNNGIFFL